MFNSRDQEADAFIDTYVAALQKSALTCNLCSCLHDSIIRDRIVLGMRSKQLRKRLLQERKRALSKCIDICRPATSSELQAISGTEIEDVNKIRHRESRDKTRKTDKTRERKGNRKTYLFCGGEHAFKKEKMSGMGHKMPKLRRPQSFSKCVENRRRHSAPTPRLNRSRKKKPLTPTPVMLSSSPASQLQ